MIDENSLLLFSMISFFCYIYRRQLTHENSYLFLHLLVSYFYVKNDFTKLILSRRFLICFKFTTSSSGIILVQFIHSTLVLLVFSVFFVYTEMKKWFSDTICGVLISSDLLAGFTSFSCYSFCCMINLFVLHVFGHFVGIKQTGHSQLMTSLLLGCLFQLLFTFFEVEI